MQHSDVKVAIDKDVCIGCSKCTHSCLTCHISINDRKDDIDNDIYYGCG